MKPHLILIVLLIAVTSPSCDKSDSPSENTGANTPAEQPPTSKHEELANEIMDSMKELATAVSAVSDLQSAEAAAKTIGEIGDRFAVIAEELKPLDPPEETLKAQINERMEERDAEMQKVMGEDLQNTMQSLNPEARQVLQDAFVEFFGKMEAAGKEFERHFNVGDQ